MNEEYQLSDYLENALFLEMQDQGVCTEELEQLKAAVVDCLDYYIEESKKEDIE